MTQETDLSNLEVSPSGEYRVDQCCTEFERAWKSGLRERIEDRLQRASAPDRQRLLFELILVETELRRAAGETVLLADYKQRFPDQAEVVKAAFAELRLPPSPDEPVSVATTVAAAGQEGDAGELIVAGAADRGTSLREVIGRYPTGTLGDFRILREIGRGGMGVVYEAEQISLGRHVALKILPHFGTIDSRSSRRFQNEARAAALLDHQNIVRVHAVGFDCGVHYYAMQLVNGTDLGQVIKALRETVSESLKAAKSTSRHGASHAEDTQSAPPDTFALFGLSDPHATPANHQYVKTFARLGIQAAEALQHAHVTGIVHRDIKPSNLLLDSDGNIRVADFGLAQIQGEAGVSATGDVVGTLRYMSPEQAYAKRVVVDHRTDIYSLGVTLYELLTLQRAFDGTNKAELLRKIAFEDPSPPCRLNKRIPVELETIVMKAMSKNPDQRYQSAGEMAEDLRRFANSEPIRARPPGFLDRFRKWCSRHKPLVAAIAFSLAIFFVASVVSSGVVWFALQRTAAALSSEKEQRRETVRLLYKSEGLRLAAQSALVRSKDPGLALAIVVEGHRLYPHRELKTALLSAFESNYEHRTLSGHRGPVGSVSFDTAGEKLITAAGRTQFGQPPESARIWSVATGELLVELVPESSTLTSAVFSPGGVRILATSTPIPPLAAGVDGTDPSHQPTIWDSLTGKKLVTLPGSYLFDAHAAAFDPAGQRVVAPAAGNTAKIWDVLEGKALVTLTGHTKRVIFAAFDATGERVATVSDDRTVRVWRSRDGGAISQLAHWSQPERAPTLAVFSPDGAMFATETTQDGIHIWNSDAGTKVNDEVWPGVAPHFTPDGARIVYTRYLDTLVRRVADGHVLHEFPGELAALSPGGTLVATLAGTSVSIWNLDSGERIAGLNGHSNDIPAAVFDRSSRRLATASYDGTARLWNLQSGAERLTYDAPLLVQHPVVAESSDARRIAVATAPRVRTQIVDLESDQAVVDVSGTVWNEDVRGQRLLTTEGKRAEVYDSGTGTKVAEFEEPGHAIFLAQLSRDGQRALIIADRGPLWLWQIETNGRIPLAGHEAAILEMDWSPDNEFAVTCSEDGTARVWDARTGAQKQTLRHVHPVVHVRVAAGGKRLAALMSNDEVILWDLARGEKTAALRPADGIHISRVEFSAAGDRLFGFREEDSQGVVCWDARNGTVMGSISPVRGRVRIAVAPGGARIVVASSVDGAMIWDPSGARQVLTEAPAAFGAFLPDDRVVLATLGLNKNPEGLGLAERRRFAAPALQIHRAADGKLLRELSTPIARTLWLSVVPDSPRVLVCGAFYGISIFDAGSHELVTSLRGQGAPASFVGFASDAVVTTSWDGTAVVWDGKSGALRRRLRAGRPISAAALSSDATRLAVGDAIGNVSVWPLDEEKPRLELKPHADLVKVIEFAPGANDRLITSSFDKTTTIHQPGNAVTQTIDPRGAIIGRVRFSADGKKGLLVPASGRVVEVPGAEAIDVHATELPHPAVQTVFVIGDDSILRSIDVDSVPVDAAFRRDGRELVTIAARKLVVWDLAAGQALRQIEFAGEPVLAGRVSADGKLAVTERHDQVSLWDLDTGDEIMTIAAANRQDTFRDAHFDPASAHLLAIAGRRLKSYPIHADSLIAQSPRQLSRAERLAFDILDEKDWPRE